MPTSRIISLIFEVTHSTAQSKILSLEATLGGHFQLAQLINQANERVILNIKRFILEVKAQLQTEGEIVKK